MKKVLFSSHLLLAAFLFLLSLGNRGMAQVNVKDSVLRFPMVQFSYAYQFVDGDMAKRFGNNSSVGIDVLYKTKSKVLLGADFRYIFGNEVKVDPLVNLRTPDGNFIGQDGYYTGVNMFERGWSVMGKIGYIFAYKGITSPNNNCGPFLTLGGGFMEHKIRIQVENNNLSGLDKEGKKGFDRLSNGPAFCGSLGYMYLSNKRLINFFLAAEFVGAFTQYQRGYDYTTGQINNEKYFDKLWGIRVGWIIPLYKRSAAEYVY
jgi:hypothetical protein